MSREPDQHKYAPTVEVGPHRARKDRRRWCGGKVGREHVVDQLVTTWQPCRVRQWWRHPSGHQVGQVTWSCGHWRACSACGKHMEMLDPQQCPAQPAVLPGPTQHPAVSRGLR